MHWWWHEFDDHDAYQEFTPVRRFVDRIDLIHQTWTPIAVAAAQCAPTDTNACSAAGRVGYHFPLDQGEVLAAYAGKTTGSAWCEQQCCALKPCDGWIFTPGHCYLKGGVTSIEPEPNCTAGLKIRQPVYRAMAMVGTANNQNQTVAVWLSNAVHIWGSQNTAAGKAQMPPTEVKIGFVSAGSYNVEIVSTSDGSTISSDQISVGAAGVLSISFPSFVGDVAALAILSTPRATAELPASTTGSITTGLAA